MKKKSKKQKIYETELGGCKVKVVDKDIDLALRILRQKFKDSNAINILKEKKEYTKPSVKRRKQILSAIYTQKIKNKEK